MATVLLEKSKKSKGILIFKNNELDFLNEDYLHELSLEFILGVYFGSFQQKKLEISKYFSFTISAKGLIDDFYNIPHINMQGWNFSASIKSSKITKNPPRYDLQSIAFNGFRKQLRHIILFFKYYCEANTTSKARIMAINNPNDQLHDQNLGSFYLKVIPFELRKRLILHKVDCFSSQKLSQYEIKKSLQESRINVIASRDEGAPRILSESLTSGIPVLLSSSTRMASIEEFNSLALKKFHSSEDFISKASKLIEISKKFNPKDIYPEFFIENSIFKISKELEHLFGIDYKLIINFYYKNNFDKVYSHYLTGHSKKINFNDQLEDDVCTCEEDVNLLTNKLLNKNQKYRNIASSKKERKNLWRKFREKIYYFKVKLIYRLNCPRNSVPDEIDKKHFCKKHTWFKKIN